MSLFNQDLFRKAINSTFNIQLDDQSFQLTLTECNDHTSENVPDYERFSLIFESKDSLLEQSTYSLQHSELGNQDLFLVPIHGDDKGFQYEATINQKISG